MSWLPFTTLSALALFAVAAAPPPVQSNDRYKPPESFTANAQFQGGSGSAATTIKVHIDRYTPDAEREAVLQALTTGGYQGFVAALRKAPAVGKVSIGEESYDVRWARAQPSKSGRSIVLVTDKPIHYIGGGRPDAKPREGFDVAVVSFEVNNVGMGTGGQIALAARVKRDETGGVAVADYADKLTKISWITRDIK